VEYNRSLATSSQPDPCYQGCATKHTGTNEEIGFWALSRSTKCRPRTSTPGTWCRGPE